MAFSALKKVSASWFVCLCISSLYNKCFLLPQQSQVLVYQYIMLTIETCHNRHYYSVYCEIKPSRRCAAIIYITWKIWGVHSGSVEESILGYDAMQICIQVPALQRIHSSWTALKLRQQTPSKHWYLYNNVHGVFPRRLESLYYPS